MLKTKCPGCRLDLQYPPKLKGRNVRCRKCGHGFRLPAQVEKKKSFLWLWLLLGGVLGAGVLLAGFLLLLLLAVGSSVHEANKKEAQETTKKGDVTLAAFLRQLPKDGAKVRVECRLEDQKNREDCPYYWIKLTSLSGEGWEVEAAWVYKTSPEGKRLYELLKDGSRHKMTIWLFKTPKGYDGATGFDPRQNSLTIKKIVHED